MQDDEMLDEYKDIIASLEAAIRILKSPNVEEIDDIAFHFIEEAMHTLDSHLIATCSNWKGPISIKWHDKY